MKKLLVVMLVLAMASIANAGLWISVNNVVDPTGEISLLKSDTAVIDIYGDGGTLPGIFWMGILDDGPGSLDISTAVVLYTGSDASLTWMDNTDMSPYIDTGVHNPFLSVSLNDVPPEGTAKKPLGPGKLMDSIIFHCDGPGLVTITLTDGDGVMIDRQSFTQLPEPITIGLLGLGALFLRRRK